MEKVFEEIKANPETKPDSVTYAALARAYLNAGLRDKAELFMLRLESGPYKKTKRTYEILMDFYADLGSREEVERLWGKCRVMQGDGASSYLVLMNALSKVGAADKVERMFQRIDSWKPNKTTDEKRYNNLLHAYRVAVENVKAEELEKKMKEAGINKIAMKLAPPARKLESKKPASEKKNKKEANVEPNIQMYNVMLELKCREGEREGLPTAGTFSTMAWEALLRFLSHIWGGLDVIPGRMKTRGHADLQQRQPTAAGRRLDCRSMANLHEYSDSS